MVIDVKPVQPLKAIYPILVTEFGIVTDVKPVHQEKADLPILVTEFGMVTDVKPLQYWKAHLPILVTGYSFPFDVIELGITTSPEYFTIPEVTSAVLPSEIML